MPYDIYKVQIFSGDGSTFIRPYLLYIPRVSVSAGYTGAGNIALKYNTALECATAFNHDYFNGIDLYQTIFALHADPASQLVNYGWQHCLILDGLFDGSMVVGNSRRLVFSTGAYILATITAYTAPNYEQITVTLAYKTPNDTQITTATIYAGLDNYGSWQNPKSSIAFPFVYRQTDGSLTNTKLRDFVGLRTGRSYQTDYTPVTWGNWGIYSSTTTWLSEGVDLADWYNGIEPVDPDDPYQDIPDSTPSGPAEGTGIPDTAGIDVPDLPSVSVTDTGFLSLFVCDLSDIKTLADYMWSSSFDLDTLRKLFANPMDCIIGLNLLPVAVGSGTPKFIKVGNLYTSVELSPATSQWVSKSMGSLVIDKPYGNYLDHAPYTKCQLYLPYIGTVPISIDDIMGKTVTLTYHVDILTCACVAFLEADGDVLYQFSGTCGYSIPISGDDYRQVVSSVISIAATAGGALISGGMAAPAAAGTMTAKQAARAAAKQAAAKVADQSLALSTGASMASNVMNAKPTIERSGAIGGSSGIMGVQRAYFIFEMPDACKPAKQYHYLGYPGFITTTVGDLSGYAEFESIILDGIACTEEERGMIEALCAGGIYV